MLSKPPAGHRLTRNNMEDSFIMDADDKLMQELEEFYFSMFNQSFPVCCDSKDDA